MLSTWSELKQSRQGMVTFHPDGSFAIGTYPVAQDAALDIVVGGLRLQKAAGAGQVLMIQPEGRPPVRFRFDGDTWRIAISPAAEPQQPARLLWFLAGTLVVASAGLGYLHSKAPPSKKLKNSPLNLPLPTAWK